MLLTLSAKLLFREIKSGYLTSVIISLTLAITIVSGISLFTDRLEKALNAQTEEFLGGNLKFESNTNKLGKISDELDLENIEQAHMALFASVIFSEQEMQLSSVKAVDNSYPLIGYIELENLEGIYKTKDQPRSGTVWIDERLKNLLDLAYGDQVYIGESTFIFTDTIIYEPDRGSGSFAFAPKTIMNISDLDSTKIIQPGSRVEYNNLFSGPENEILLIREFLEKTKESGDDIEMLGDDSSSLGRAVDRSENFFLLGGLIAVLLSACTISISSQRFTRRHISYVAILKTLGMQTSNIRSLYFLIFLYTTFLTLLMGISLGWLLQNSFIDLMSAYFPTELPNPGFYPILVTCLTAFICQFGFIYPHILKLLATSPMRVLKDDIKLNQDSLPVIAAGLIAFFVLLYLYTYQLALSLIIFIGIIGFSLMGIGSIYLLIGKRNIGLGASNPLQLALSELRRRKLGNSLQIFAFTIAIGLSLVTFSASKNLLGSWQNSIPEDSPNNFAINITEQDRTLMKSFLKTENIVSSTFYPVANASIAKIEDNSVTEIDRNFNITWIRDLPNQNEVLEGEWFSNKKKNGISVSDEIAERYKLDIGDEVLLKIDDKNIETYVQSLRAVNWDNFSPNFFVIVSPELVEEVSSTFITSFYIPKDKQEIAAKLMREFRTVSIFSIEELIKQVKEIIDQVSKALNSILLLTCLSSMFLAVAALQDGFSVRKHQSAILRTLGASSSLIKKSALIEFASLGLLSGFLGSVISSSGVYFIETRVFQTTANFYPELFILGPILGLFVVSGICLYLINGIVKKSPKELFN